MALALGLARPPHEEERDEAHAHPSRIVPGVLSRIVRVAAYAAPLPIAYLLHVPICPIARVMRRPCPGCGMTRALVALVSGDFQQALALNPLAPIVWPPAIALVVW